MEIRDRRPPRPLPEPEDYEKPLTRAAITEANRKYLQTGVRGRLGTDTAKAQQIIRETTKERFKARRRSGEEPLGTLGEYLEYLAERSDERA